jgi:hypothetical protein
MYHFIFHVLHVTTEDTGHVVRRELVRPTCNLYHSHGLSRFAKFLTAVTWIAPYQTVRRTTTTGKLSALVVGPFLHTLPAVAIRQRRHACSPHAWSAHPFR